VLVHYDLAIAPPVEIAARVHRLGNSIFNWYLVEDGGRLTAVDAGLPGFGRDLVADLASLGFSLGDIEAVVLTHSDADQTGLVPMIHEAGARVLINADDQATLRKPGPKSGDASPTHILGELWRPTLWRTIFGMVQAQGYKLEKITYADSFGDGDVLDVPGHPRVIATPGHTAGHSALFFETHGALFVGDAMCTLNMVTHGRGPQLMPRAMNESNAQALASLDALDGIEAAVMAFGHGEPWRDGVTVATTQARGRARSRS